MVDDRLSLSFLDNLRNVVAHLRFAFLAIAMGITGRHAQFVVDREPRRYFAAEPEAFVGDARVFARLVLHRLRA